LIMAINITGSTSGGYDSRSTIPIFLERAFVSTGHHIITEDYTLNVSTKCTAIIYAVAQGDRYARPFEVYSDGVMKHQSTIMNSVTEHVNLGFLEAGRHTLGVKIASFVGGWTVTAGIFPDTVETPTIEPPQVQEDLALIAPAPDIGGPATLAPPATDAPIPDAPTADPSGWSWLLKPSIRTIPTQAEIDARNRDTNKLLAIAQTGIKQVTHLDIVPSASWVESTSIPLSVQAVNDRLKDLPMGYLPQLDFGSGTMGSPEYGPTELSSLTGGLFASHRDNFGRDVVSFGSDFSMESNMILLGMGLAALAAAAFFKRNEIAKLIKR
jgi:hypothetical protein